MHVDLLLRRVNLATMVDNAADPYGCVHYAALAVSGGRIVWLGKEAALPAGLIAEQEVDGDCGWLTPGLIDCQNSSAG